MPRRGIETTIIPMTPEERREWAESNGREIVRAAGERVRNGARPSTIVPTDGETLAQAVDAAALAMRHFNDAAAGVSDALAAERAERGVVPAVPAAPMFGHTVRVHTTRRCAYEKWAPKTAAMCECWKCTAAREYARCFIPAVRLRPRVIIIPAPVVPQAPSAPGAVDAGAP